MPSVMKYGDPIFVSLFLKGIQNLLYRGIGNGNNFAQTGLLSALECFINLPLLKGEIT